ncbi:cysteine--tRNA ligase [Pikeienuella sp. HZG-20]|uniref:cysteine--tRNA ligase n=1 Tax=Paludibacillus litoralis TaxID=3133267 RepID=UPI0030EE358A
MTEIRLHNSATREKEIFAPEDPRNVRMYVCGPTVYDRAHIGNARPAVVFDVLFRLLRHRYGEAHVTYVRNITDIDDKIMARAKERGVSIGEITAETTAWYRDDMAALGCLPPTHEPRATEFVPEMIAMIEVLVAKGNAYVTEGHVLFEVATWPEYGGLSGRSTDDMIAGARSETAPGKRSPMDFVLWKPSAADQPGWDSPWGRGRPGWHIECSAMASKLLGETFDIHGGGGDLMFPHHENEIAQSCCAAPDSGFARVWMHNGMINVDGRKMSKSLGNFLTVEDLRGQAPGEVLRLALLGTHYRGTLDWTQQRMDEAAAVLTKWRAAIEGASPKVPHVVVEALADDLNTPAAIAELHRFAREGDGGSLAGGMALMNLRAPNLELFQEVLDSESELIEELLAERSAARAAKEFGRADTIRKRLDAAGVLVIDEKGGPSEWRRGPGFDPKKLYDNLSEQR